MSDTDLTRRSVLAALGAGVGATSVGASLGALPAEAQTDCVACGDGDADKVGQLTFRYTGSASAEIAVYNDKEAKDDALVYGPTTVEAGGEFTVTAPSDKGEFETETSLYVNGTKDAQFHTSCSRPIGPGLAKGSFEIVAGEDSTGATLCEVECALCGDSGDADGIAQLTFSYDGSDTVAIYNDKEAKQDALLFEGTPSGPFTVRAVDVGEDKLKSDISLYVGGEKAATLHTSCSQPLYPGQTVAGFTVEGGRTKNGRALCSLDDLGCAECGDDGDADGVVSATLEYTGDRTNGTVEVYNDKEMKSEALLATIDLENTRTVSFSASDVDEETLKSDISVYLNDERNARFHTSCSRPFGPGIQKGDFKVLEASTDMGRGLCEIECQECGGEGDADGVNSLTLEYTGDPTTLSDPVARVYNDKEAKPEALLAEVDLTSTTTIPFSASTVDEEKLKSDVSVYVGGSRNARFHTSCSRPLGLGVQQGDFRVVDGFTAAGAELCEAGCANCRSEGDVDGVSRLELRYNGDTEAWVQVYNDKEVKQDAVLFDGFVSPDGVIEISAATLGEEKLKSDVGVYVETERDAIFHTSCSQTLGPGVERGSFTVVGGTDVAGRDLCTVAGGDCVTCGDGGDADAVRELTLKYAGTDTAFVEVVNDKEYKSDEILFAETLEPGSNFPSTDTTFTISAAAVDEDKLSSDISVFVNGEKNATIHTSCSQPLGPGQQFGDFTVVAAEDKVGRKLCEIECAICGGDAEGIEAEGVSQLELGYLGNSPARVRVYNDKDQKADALLFDSTDFDDDGRLDRGDTFTISASTVDEDKLKSDISLFVGETKETLHTSCSRPLGPGVRTSGGTFVVVSGQDRAGLNLCPGGGTTDGELALCPPDQTLLARYRVTNGSITFVDGRDELGIGSDSVSFSNVQTNASGGVVGFEVDSGPYDLGSVTVRFGTRVERFDPNDPSYGTGPGPSEQYPNASGPETTVVDLTQRVDGTPVGITEILLCAPVFWQVDIDVGEVVETLPSNNPVALAGLGSNPEGFVMTRNPSGDGRQAAEFDGLDIDGEFDIDFDADTISIGVRVEDSVSEPIQVYLATYEMPGAYRRDEAPTQVLFDVDVRDLSPGEYTFTVDLPTP